MNAKHNASRAKAPRFEKYDYAETDFAVSGEITNFEVMRVHCASDSCTHDIECEGYSKMNQSDWSILYDTGARLTDGTIVFEGYCPECHEVESTQGGGQR